MLFSHHTKRREVIALLGGAMAWPLAGRAQSAMPVVGVLGGTSRIPSLLDRTFMQGLHEAGYTEGQGVRVVYRWAGGVYERLPDLAPEGLAHWGSRTSASDACRVERVP
jgi:putative ABC transport system substrate-binding protein